MSMFSYKPISLFFSGNRNTPAEEKIMRQSIYPIPYATRLPVRIILNDDSIEDKSRQPLLSASEAKEARISVEDRGTY
jgi:hypothetical protein